MQPVEKMYLDKTLREIQRGLRQALDQVRGIPELSEDQKKALDTRLIVTAINPIDRCVDAIHGEYVDEISGRTLTGIVGYLAGIFDLKARYHLSEGPGADEFCPDREANRSRRIDLESAIAHRVWMCIKELRLKHRLQPQCKTMVHAAAGVSQRPVLSNKEVERIINAADTLIKPVIMGMRWMGLSSSELRRIDWGQAKRRGGRWWIDVPNPDCRHFTPTAIPPRLWDMIEKLSAEDRTQLFSGPHSALARRFRRAAEAAGLAGVDIYDLRRESMPSKPSRKANPRQLC